jgi:hypothetical protein
MLDRFGVLPEVVKEIPIPKPKPGRRKKVKWHKMNYELC